MRPEHQGREVTAEDFEGTGHIASEVKKQGMTNVCAQLGFVFCFVLFFCLTQSWPLIQGMVPPMVNVGPPTSMNLTETVPPRLLDSVKLKIRAIIRNKPIL